MTADTTSERLRERAESYARDGSTLRREGDTDAAVIYETIASELRKVAAEIVSPEPPTVYADFCGTCAPLALPASAASSPRPAS